MDPVSKAFTIVFLVATMLSIGLKVTVADLVSSLRDRRWMARTLVANFVLIPAIGLILTFLIPMSIGVKVGFLLLAVAPGGLNAIQFTSKTTDGLSYAATTLFVLSFLSVLVSPLLAAAVIPLETSLALPYVKAIAFLLLGVMGPLGIGLVVHHYKERLAHMLAKPVAIVGTLSFVVVVILLWGVRKQAKADIATSELAAMLVFIVAAMGVGWALGGASKEMRRILATASSMRNAALGLMIAASSFPETNVGVAVIAFSAMMIPVNMLFTLYEIIQARRAKRLAGADIDKVTMQNSADSAVEHSRDVASTEASGKR